MAKVVGAVVPPRRIVCGHWGCDDGAPGSLKRLNDPAVVREICRQPGFRCRNPLQPQVFAASLEAVKAMPEIEFTGQHGMTDGQAPQQTRLTRLGIEVGECADDRRRLGQSVLVVQEGESHRCGAHQ
jgi:hypothetical protein